jgi:hypothetical protein
MKASRDANICIIVVSILCLYTAVRSTMTASLPCLHMLLLRTT